MDYVCLYIYLYWYNSVFRKYVYCIFFFQAEDGIRDLYVTGVQTCALPISMSIVCPSAGSSAALWRMTSTAACLRSEERRVGKSVDLGGRRIIKKKKKQKE